VQPHELRVPRAPLLADDGQAGRRRRHARGAGNGIPVVRLGKGDRKIDVMQPYLAAQAATGRSGVAAVGVAQEFARVWAAYQRDTVPGGRPANVEIIFGRRIQRNTPGVFRTAIDRGAVGPDNQGVIVNVSCKHSRVKRYLKDGRAIRIEIVINAPRDLGCNARLPNLAELQDKARAVNRLILDVERGGQGSVLASPAFERIAHPSVTADGRRTPALRSGDPRVQALGRRPLQYPARRLRHHEQEPARLELVQDYLTSGRGPRSPAVPDSFGYSSGRCQVEHVRYGHYRSMLVNVSWARTAVPVLRPSLRLVIRQVDGTSIAAHFSALTAL
jgi:hypothetical protein